jgi:hypothetical protein
MIWNNYKHLFVNPDAPVMPEASFEEVENLRFLEMMQMNGHFARLKRFAYTDEEEGL